MKTAVEKLGSSYLLVNADGNPVPNKDSDRYKLHVIPKLYIPFTKSGDGFTKDSISLVSANLIIDNELINILPENLLIRQPYPNGEYYVAGTIDRKIGWEIDAPDADLVQIEFKWEVHRNSEFLPCKISHKIILNLCKSKQGHVFSFDESDFAGSPVPRIVGFIDPSDESDFFHKGVPSTIAKNNCDLIGFKVEITQDVTLTSKAYSDLMFDTFEQR